MFRQEFTEDIKDVELNVTIKVYSVFGMFPVYVAWEFLFISRSTKELEGIVESFSNLPEGGEGINIFLRPGERGINT